MNRLSITLRPCAIAVALMLVCAVCIAHAQSDSDAAYFANGGSIDLFSSSHQDIAWMDTPQACMLFRVNQCITPALDLMAKKKSYSFVMENMLNLAEFLEQRPEQRSTVERLTLEGRLEWGATFNQPYEDLLSGEELVRETYFGCRWLKRTFPGADARVAFSPDVPGRSLQMPQILAKSGVPYMLISRYHEGLYRWFSPDGSGILVYTPGHYSVTTDMLASPVANIVQALKKKLADQNDYYARYRIPPVLPLLNSYDFSRPVDFDPLLDTWNAQRHTGPDSQTIGVPVLQYSSVRNFFEQIDKPTAQLRTLTGARPNLWLYIGGPTHHWAITAKREAAVLLPAAETFSTVRSLLDGNWQKYPAQRFSDAWKAEIYPDHGWGGKNGHITDIVFKEKAELARTEAKTILADALNDIASRIQTGSRRGTPVVVFNALSWTRSDPVVVDAGKLGAGPLRIVDAAGKEVPSQVTAIGNPDEINVAAASQGSKVTADSSAGPESGADRAIDDKWSHMDADRWVSADGTGPHWLVVDFGQPRTIHKIVLRHEGSLGAFKDIDEFNTTDFQLQWSNSSQGPWQDLVSPVRGNVDVLTTHRFAPKRFRYLRIYITRAGSKAGEPARLFEVEAFAPVARNSDKLVLLADDVPATGYKTFYAVAAHTHVSARTKSESPSILEDDHYRISLAPGGVKSIFDKDLGRELLDTGKFLGGEIFTMQSVGNGAGEFTEVQQPTMEGFDKVSNHKPRWKYIESGPVRTVVEFTSEWPAVTVRQQLALYHTIKRIDFDVALLGWKGTMYREFRIAWPVKSPNGQVAYEVPMGIVGVGKSELQTTGGHAYGNVNYTQPIPEIRPREVRDFIGVNDGQLGLTLSSSVSVFDYKDPTSNPVPYPVLQAILLASRKSCHEEGNWYLQPGDHYYHFSLTSHSPGWNNGYKRAIQANNPLFPIINARPVASASLPAERSFFTVSPGNLVVSTVKKSEDNDAAVIRFYDMEGHDSKATVQSFFPVANAERVNLIEEDGKPLSAGGNSVELTVGHHAIETVKLAPQIAH